jgi:hypothetical protein
MFNFDKCRSISISEKALDKFDLDKDDLGSPENGSKFNMEIDLIFGEIFFSSGQGRQGTLNHEKGEN